MVEVSRALRKRQSKTRQAQPATEFLAFQLAQELYAVQLSQVREIVSPPPIAFVPRAPRQVLGICSVRGLLVTVLDLRRCLDLPESPLTRRARVLLTQVGTGEVLGLLVDEVRQVIRLTASDIEPTQAVFGVEMGGMVTGIARSELGTCVLLRLGSGLGV
jgi:purine-binding chemotaxis protein CheW